MAGITLEEIILVKIGITLWIGDEIKVLMKKNSSGLIDMEKTMPLVINVASNFPVCESLKQRLIDIIEKIGYQLYLFLTKPYIDTDFELGTIKWTTDGLISGSETLRELMRKTEKYTISEFQFSCELFDELLIREIWYKLDENDRKFHREAGTCHVFTTYWVKKMDENLILSDSFSKFIIGYKRHRSWEMNILWHSIAVNNRAAIRYFLQRLSESELFELELRDFNSSELEILKYLLKTPNNECLPYILSFLEMPISNERAQQLIIGMMNPKSIKNILDHVLRRVNVCGDLHYKIFRFLLFNLRHKWTIEVKDNLHFYALNLLSKGRIEKFEYLPNEFKKILLRQIIYRLKSKRGLAIFVTVHWNNHTHLLSEFLDWLADDEQDRNFFREFVSAIIEAWFSLIITVQWTRKRQRNMLTEPTSNSTKLINRTH